MNAYLGILFGGMFMLLAVIPISIECFKSEPHLNYTPILWIAGIATMVSICSIARMLTIGSRYIFLYTSLVDNLKRRGLVKWVDESLPEEFQK